MRLRRLFWLVFILCSVIPPLILSVFLITRSYNTEKNLVLRNLQTTSAVLSTSLSNILDANRTDIAATFEGPALQRVLASGKDFRELDKDSKEYLVKVFKSRVRASTLVMGVALMDKEGYIAASSNEQLMGSKNPLPENSLEKAKEKKGYYLTDTFYIPLMTKVPLYAMIMPLYDSGNFRGALGFSFSADFIQKLVDRAELTKRFQTRLITVVDRNNRIISTSDPDFYRGESLSNYLEKPLSEGSSDISGGENGAPKKPELVRFKTSTGNNIGYFSRIEENGWGLMLSIDENEIMAPLREMILWNALFAAAVIIAVSMIFTRLSSYFSGPVLKLTDAMERYRRGDQSARFEYRGDDEFGQIAVTFNEMAETLNVVLSNEKLKSKYYENKSNVDQLSGILNKAA
ncbi:MAG: cache domain-containing protein, partial [Synergistaceae bacterium]|nr:cache domain-containing protein [Synergistaceae bacterium]